MKIGKTYVVKHLLTSAEVPFTDLKKAIAYAGNDPFLLLLEATNYAH